MSVSEYGMPIAVHWDNETRNVYNHEDLIAWQGSVSRTPTMADIQQGTRLISRRNVIYGAGVGEGTELVVTRIRSATSFSTSGGWIFREVDLENFELIPNPDVQSSTGIPVTQEWVVTVDGNICSDDETFSSREEAEMALVSPEFHNLRAMGRHVAVQQL